MATFSALIAATALGLAALMPTAAQAEEASAQTAWRLLDYVSVDYGEAVSNGAIVSASEYAEMTEFDAQISARIAALPSTAGQPALVEKAKAQQAAIAARQDPKQVAALAHGLAGELLAAYPTPLALARAPDLARGAALYTEQYSTCHGATGKADGPGGTRLNPPPIAFADVERARQRSVFGLYQVIQQGLDGTAMASFSRLPSDDRWALALYVGRFAFTEDEAKTGERLWNEDAALRARFPNLEALTQAAPAALAEEILRVPLLSALFRQQLSHRPYLAELFRDFLAPCVYSSLQNLVGIRRFPGGAGWRDFSTACLAARRTF